MKQFLKSTVLFLLPILVFGISAELLLRHIPNDYELKKNYMEKHGKDITILFLGSSHAFFGVNPAYIKEKSFNAAYVSQTLDLDHHILEKYSKDLTKLKLVVIPVSYFSLYRSLKDSEESWRLKKYDIYYGIKTTADFSSRFEMSEKFEPNMYKLYSYHIKKNSFITSSNLGWGTHTKPNYEIDLLTTGISAAKRYSGMNRENFAKNKAILEHIISFAKQKNMRVLFYTPPAYKTYTEHLNTKQLNETTNLMVDFASKYNNVAYLNLLNVDTLKYQDFYDADHLNVAGAKKFSVMLDGLIQDIPLTEDVF